MDHLATFGLPGRLGLLKYRVILCRSACRQAQSPLFVLKGAGM
jgi:hypothetical protein